MNKIKNRKQSLVAGGVFLSLFAPSIVLAAQGDLLFGVFQTLSRVVNLLLPVASTLVLVYFFWGLATYVLSAGDEEKAKKGKSIMIYGLLAAFIVLSLSGVVYFLQNTFGINDSAGALIDVKGTDLPFR